jgi:hypothetical protein
MITPQNFWLWFGGIWLSVGSLFLVIGISVGVQRIMVKDRLEKEGRSTQGVVLTKEVYTTSSKNGSRSSPSYRVTFRFAPRQGEIVHGTADVTVETWEELQERGPIHVVYLPDAPQSHHVLGQSKAEVVLPLIFGVLGGILSSIGGFIVFSALGKRKCEKELRRTGGTTEAIVTDSGPANIRINGIPQWKLRYRFQDPSGALQIGATTLTPEEAQKWQPGQTGKVRYDLRRPRTNLWVGKE